MGRGNGGTTGGGEFREARRGRELRGAGRAWGRKKAEDRRRDRNEQVGLV